MSEHVCRAGSDEDTSRCFLCGASVTPIDSAPSDGLTDEDKRRIRSEANLHMIEWLEDTEAEVDTLTAQLREQRERESRKVDDWKLALKERDEYRSLLTAAERTVREQREVIEAAKELEAVELRYSMDDISAKGHRDVDDVWKNFRSALAALSPQEPTP